MTTSKEKQDVENLVLITRKLLSRQIDAQKAEA